MATKTLKIETSILSREEHESVLQFIINEENILMYLYQDEKSPRTTVGNIDAIIDYLQETLNFIKFDNEFPYKNDGKSASEMTILARNYDSDDLEEFDAYYDKLDDWVWSHSWLHERDYFYIADIMFRKVDDCIEISWDNHDLYEDVQFLSLEGCVRIPCEEYRKVILKAVADYNKLWNKE